MTPSSSSGKPKKLPKPLPAHRCGSRVCCNFIVPPTRAKYKYQFCSDECGQAQRKYEWHYSSCRTCAVEIKRESNRYYCDPCEAKREQRRQERIASGKVPKKPCVWLFCQKEFQPSTSNQKYCSAECRKGAAGGRTPGPGYPTEMPPADDRHGFCAGNCGTHHYWGWRGLSAQWGPSDTHCDPCYLGHKHGTRPLFGPPLPKGWHRCQWVFCNALYRAESSDQRGCCALHEQLPQAGEKGWPRHIRLGWDSTHPCANNCGTTIRYSTQPVCLSCSLGLRHGRVNPFPEDAEARARWGEPVVHFTDKQMAAEWDHLRPPFVPAVRPCAWVFCGEAFTEQEPGQRYCSPRCRACDEARATNGEGWEAPRTLSDVLCAGGCGRWTSGPVGSVLERCLHCALGQRLGTRNPYPPVPALRTAAERGWTLPLEPGATASSDDDDEWLGEATEWKYDGDEPDWTGSAKPQEPSARTCAWAFCGEPFVGTDCYCSPECRRYADGTGLRRLGGHSYPESPSNVLCEGGCGRWMPGPVGGITDPDDGHHRYTDICYGCFVGLRYGKRNPYPRLPADRTAARYYLTEQQLAEELDCLPLLGPATAAAPVGEGEGLDEDWEWLTPENSPDTPAELFDAESTASWGALRVSVPLQKRCAWVFCGEPFRSRSVEQLHCCAACARHDEKRAEWRGLTIGQGWAYPKERTDVPCAGGCGRWLQGGLLERCFPCETGRKYGKRNPYPPVPADRTAARYYLSQAELDAELDYLRAEPASSTRLVTVALAVLTGLASLIAGGLVVWWAQGQ